MRKTFDLKLILPVLLLLVCFWWPSFYGLNFGVHWDETRAKFDSVKNSINTGLFMQGSGGEPDGFHYNYGGVNYLLTWTGFAPELVKYFRGPHTREALSAIMTPVIYGTEVRLRVRAIYLLLSSLSILWLYCLNIVLGRTRLEAFLAAAILGCSWEVAYHSRWIAPDAIMMQFAVLSFLCIALGKTRSSVNWFYIGAVAVGLAAGTKYPGGLILPFLLAGAGHTLWRESRSLMSVFKHGVGLLATSGLTFLLTTPGALLDPFHFFKQLHDQRTIYSTGWYGYTVKPGFHHLVAILKYFSLQIFSHYWTISILFAVLSVLGFAALILRPKLMGLLMTGFVLAYLLYFSAQAAMIVRNLLVVVPFLCLAAARGVHVVAERLSPRLRPAVHLLVGLLLVVNLGWEIYAAQQVKKRANQPHFVKQFMSYVQNSPGDTYLVSAKLAALLGAQSLPSNIITDPGTPHTRVAFLQTQGADVFWETWPSNAWGLYTANFGALEVNLEAYTTFVGNQRILVVTNERFAQLPLKEKDLLLP